jgi:hypothetical protein
MVFSHPNHEIAVLGTIFRLRPHIIYLTDGGGEQRVAQTRQALKNYQPASVHYLNHSEQSLYDALLNRDAEFYRALAEEAGDIIAELGADTVYCDAVEFYNPVHDIALPVVRAALRGNDVPIIEVPPDLSDHRTGAEIRAAACAALAFEPRHLCRPQPRRA